MFLFSLFAPFRFRLTNSPAEGSPLLIRPRFLFFPLPAAELTLLPPSCEKGPGILLRFLKKSHYFGIARADLFRIPAENCFQKAFFASLEAEKLVFSLSAGEAKQTALLCGALLLFLRKLTKKSAVRVLPLFGENRPLLLADCIIRLRMGKLLFEYIRRRILYASDRKHPADDHV